MSPPDGASFYTGKVKTFPGKAQHVLTSGAECQWCRPGTPTAVSPEHVALAVAAGQQSLW